MKVWRWMADSETNLRTVRIKVEKHASFRKNQQIAIRSLVSMTSYKMKCRFQ